MLGSIWNFVKRHKKKFIFTGALVGGVYISIQYARRKMLEFQESEAAECIENAKRQHHFDNNQRTCNMTVLAMLPSIKQALMQELDSEALTDELKKRPVNKVEIWEELKIISFTRTLSCVYCVCLVIVFLRIQLNVIGGYMYIDSVNAKDGLTGYVAKASPEVQGQYLALVQYICDEGLKELTAFVRQHVQHNLQSISLRDELSLLQLQSVLNRVRQGVEVSQHGVNVCPLAHFLMPATQDEHKSAMMKRLWQETKDLVDSGDFRTVLTTCLDSAFSRLVDRLAEYYKPPAASPNGLLSSSSGHHMPLAKIIPVVNGLVHTILADAPNPYVQDLLLKEQMKDFAANIYEAFTIPHTSHSQGPA